MTNIIFIPEKKANICLKKILSNKYSKWRISICKLGKIMQIFEIFTFFAKTLQQTTKLYLAQVKSYKALKMTLLKFLKAKKKFSA